MPSHLRAPALRGRVNVMRGRCDCTHPVEGGTVTCAFFVYEEYEIVYHGYSAESLEIRGVFCNNAKHSCKKTGFYGENPIAKRFGMGFSQVTVHALERACTVTYHVFELYLPLMTKCLDDASGMDKAPAVQAEEINSRGV